MDFKLSTGEKCGLHLYLYSGPYRKCDCVRAEGDGVEVIIYSCVTMET